MALKKILDKLTDVDEALRSQYVEKDGKFVLDVEGDEDVSGLKSALKKERDARQELDRKMAKYRDIDPEKYTELVKEKEEFERTALEKKGDFDKLKNQLVEQHGKELKAKDEKLTARERFIEKIVAENVAVAEITAAGGNPKLLKPHVMQSIRVVEEDGEFKAKVVDAKGNVRIANGKGDEMTITDLIAELKGSNEFAPAFAGTGSTGSGAPPKTGAPPKAPAGKVSATDPNAFLTNLADIAAGKVQVTS